jgi:hypothetical protein
MHVQSLHRKVIRDMDMMLDPVNRVFPTEMPRCYTSRDMNLGPFIRRLNKVTKRFHVWNEIADDVTMPKGMSATSGLWYPEDSLPENGSEADVRVIWHIHPDSRRVGVTPAIWARRRYYFWSRIAHEFVHRYQDLGRDEHTMTRTFKVRTAKDDKALEQKQYYSDYDELEAYAHDSALEMITWYPGCPLKECLTRVRQIPSDALVEATYNCYMNTFEMGHPARTHFRRKVKQWFTAMEQTSDFYEKLSLPKIA